MRRAAELARLQRQREMMVCRQARDRAEAEQVAAGVAETVALSQARGAAIGAVGKGAKPYRRQAGLEWLAMKGRLSVQQKAAGERYGALYRRASAGARIGSSLEIKPDMGSPGGPSLPQVLARAEATAQASARLMALRQRLSHHPALFPIQESHDGRSTGIALRAPAAFFW